MNKKRKYLSIPLLSSILIVPIISLSMDFFNSNKIQISKTNEYNENIFSISDMDNNILRNSALNNDKKNFFKSSDYRKYFKLNDVAKVNINSSKSLPISFLNGYVSDYLEFDPYGGVWFKRDKLYEEVAIERWIRDNIGVDLISDSYLFSKWKLESLGSHLEFENHKDLLKLLDLEYEDNDEFDQKVIKKLCNENFNDDDGIFYMMAEAPRWSESDQLSFMDSINKDGQINIIEIKWKSATNKTGFFILKVRTMRTTYTDNLEIYNEIMNNFEKCFTPIIGTYDYEDWDIDQLITKEKIIGYKTIIPDEIIQDIPLLEKMKEVASNSREEIFDYKNIIFNDENRKYEYEVKDELNELSKKVDEIKEVYFQEKEVDRKPIYPVVNIGLIFAIVIPIIIVVIIITFIIFKILRDKKHIKGK